MGHPWCKIILRTEKQETRERRGRTKETQNVLQLPFSLHSKHRFLVVKIVNIFLDESKNYAIFLQIPVYAVGILFLPFLLFWQKILNLSDTKLLCGCVSFSLPSKPVLKRLCCQFLSWFFSCSRMFVESGLFSHFPYRWHELLTE